MDTGLPHLHTFIMHRWNKTFSLQRLCDDFKFIMFIFMDLIQLYIVCTSQIMCTTIWRIYYVIYSEVIVKICQVFVWFA